MMTWKHARLVFWEKTLYSSWRASKSPLRARSDWKRQKSYPLASALRLVLLLAGFSHCPNFNLITCSRDPSLANRGGLWICISDLSLLMICKRWFNYHWERGLPFITHSSKYWVPKSIPFFFQIGKRPREQSLKRFVESTRKRWFGLQKPMEWWPDLSHIP